MFVFVAVLVAAALASDLMSQCNGTRVCAVRKLANEEWETTQEYNENAYACGCYNAMQASDGTDYLWVETYGAEDDSLSAEAAGYVEGALSHKAMHYHFLNVRGDIYTLVQTDEGEEYQMSDGMRIYCEEQRAYMEKMIGLMPEEPFWKQVSHMLSQLHGLYLGYVNNYDRSIDVALTEWDLYYINMLGDNDDLAEALNVISLNDVPVSNYVMPKKYDGRHPKYGPFNYDIHNHCTASVRFVNEEENKDIFVSQDTWSGYNSLLRIMKSYDFRYSTSKVEKVVFSSYPIALFSIDDLYVLDNNISIFETTFHTWEPQLYAMYVTPLTVPTWIRVQVANRLCKNGVSWTRQFRRYNSGTYNNQYVIVDYNKFDEYKAELAKNKDAILKPNTAVVIEMGPGISKVYDGTPQLRDSGYIRGINTPHPKLMFAYLGYSKKQYDPMAGYWGYETGSRYKIFDQYMPDVNTFEKFKNFIRYNNYLDEPLAREDPGSTILSRYDLRITEEEAAKLSEEEREQLGGHYGSGFGGLDGKATNSELVKNMSFVIKPCPHSADDVKDYIFDNQYKSYEEKIPAWKFANNKYNVPSNGLRQDNYVYDWVTFSGNELNTDME